MYNFDQEPERRHLVDESGLNTFLSKLYGLMALAVLVSALSSYLTMTVFARQMLNLMNNHPWTMWFLLLLPIALTLIINFNATRSPGMSFVLLMLTAIVYGVTFAFIAGAIREALFSFLPLLHQSNNYFAKVGIFFGKNSGIQKYSGL